MKNKRVLYVAPEVSPYLSKTIISDMAFQGAKAAHYNGIQTRIFMPKFGLINERRYQLHEVIRLSGMNLIINDIDVPLVIKVASIPRERMQVYFIDNDEYFYRKGTFIDKNGKLFQDNDERLIFFSKSVAETVKKLNWAPDVIHLHGWETSLLALYLRSYYKDEPLFAQSKIVTSLYEQDFDGDLGSLLIKKIKFDRIEDQYLTYLQNPTYHNVLKNAIHYSDAIVQTKFDIHPTITDCIEKNNKPLLVVQSNETYPNDCLDFYKNELLQEGEEDK